MDCGTSEANEEYLALSTRFLDSNKESLITSTKLLALLPLKESATGVCIAAKVAEFLFSGASGLLRLKNCVGISTDAASNMISAKSAGATQQLRSFHIQDLVITHDLCHAFNLVAQKSLQSFPDNCRNIVSRLCNFFSMSAQRSSELKSFLAENQEKILTVKRYVPTRWTSFADSLKRILELYEPLEKYFTMFRARKGKVKKTETGDMKLFSKENHLMLRLLFTLLEKLTINMKIYERDDVPTYQIDCSGN